MTAEFAAAATLPSERPRPRIRLRFTALYATTLLVVLLAASAALRFALLATLQREFDNSVRAWGAALNIPNPTSAGR